MIKSFTQWKKLRETAAVSPVASNNNPYDVRFGYGDENMDKISALEKELASDDIEHAGHMTGMSSEEHKKFMQKHLELAGYYEEKSNKHYRIAKQHQTGARYADVRDKTHDLGSPGTYYPPPEGKAASDPYSKGASGD